AFWRLQRLFLSRLVCVEPCQPDDMVLEFSPARVCLGALDGIVPAFRWIGSDAADDLSAAKLATAPARILDAHGQQSHFFHARLSKRFGGRNSALAAAVAGSFVQDDRPSRERLARGIGGLVGLCGI